MCEQGTEPISPCDTEALQRTFRKRQILKLDKLWAGGGGGIAKLCDALLYSLELGLFAPWLLPHLVVLLLTHAGG